MGKSSKTPSSVTTTQTSTPYLTSDVNYAAQQARNLYQGYTPQMSQIYGQINDLNSQIAKANTAPTYYGTNSENMPRPQIDTGYIQSLTQQRDALQSQLNGMNPNLPQYYPGQTYVDYSPETMQALQSITDRANAGSALQRGGNDLLTATVRGDYLNSNPYIDNVVNTALDDVTRKYINNVLPGLASNFAQSGRYGSGIQQNVTADAIGQLGKEAMGVAGGIRFDNYNNERARQLNAAAIAPTYAASDYADADRLMGVGSAREALAQAKLQDEMDRFNFYQNQPSNLLDQYINRISALNSGSGTVTQTGPGAARPSAFGGALSGGLGGLSIGSMLAPQGATGLAALGGLPGVGLGIGGALLGGLFN